MISKYCRINKTKKGFTLAEILVTLGVIGVIASMTVPNLIQDIQDAQFKTAWKKAFADISQVSLLVLQEKGGSFINSFSSSEGVKNAFMSKLSYTKSCEASETPGSCWHTGTGFQHLNGSKGGTREYPGLILNDGKLVMFLYRSTNCMPEYAPGVSWCASIYFDVNGFKGPNMVSKDIFYGQLTSDSFIPAGALDSTIDGTCPGSSGWACSAKYLYQ